jgi:hypothetical protein
MQVYYSYRCHYRLNEPNPFLCYGRLSEVDGYACIEESRLKYIDDHQDELRYGWMLLAKEPWTVADNFLILTFF